MSDLCLKNANCGTLADWFKRQGRYHSYTETPQPGDVVFYDWNKKHTNRDHTGIVESVNSDGSIKAIEGNTAIGNDSNGGEVMERTRTKTYITGYGRPAYDGTYTAAMAISAARAELGTKESPANSNNVKYNTWFYNRAVSGATTYPWCAVFVCWVLLVGILSEPATTTTTTTATGGNGKVNLALDELKIGSSGGEVTAIQQMLKCPGYYTLNIDGSFGSKTDASVRAYQKANGLIVDGVVGKQTWTKLLGA